MYIVVEPLDGEEEAMTLVDGGILSRVMCMQLVRRWTVYTMMK